MLAGGYGCDFQQRRVGSGDSKGVESLRKDSCGTVVFRSVAQNSIVTIRD
jgi:hypothetical protein